MWWWKHDIQTSVQNKMLSEPSHISLFIYWLWHLLFYSRQYWVLPWCWVVMLQRPQRSYNPQSWKYVLAALYRNHMLTSALSSWRGYGPCFHPWQMPPASSARLHIFHVIGTAFTIHSPSEKAYSLLFLKRIILKTRALTKI